MILLCMIGCTVFLIYVYLFLKLFQGALTEVTGPVIPELVAQTNSDYEDMLQAISMRGAGHIIGGILGTLSLHISHKKY